MHFAFTAEQAELRRAARSFLDSQSSPARVRAASESATGHDEAAWARAAQELGWASLAIPEVYGGAGLTTVELSILLEEMGRALFCAPFFSTVCLGANALLAGGSEAQKEALLPGVAAGEVTATLAVTETSGRWDASAVEAIARRDGEGFVLTGQKAFVLDGHTADLVVVAARAPGSRGEEGVSLFVVPSDAPGLTRRRTPTMDATRALADVALDGVRLPRSALLGDEGAGWAIAARTHDLAMIGLAAEQVGGAERCLEMAVDYAKVRHQFGRAIGSFQAIKHKCADMMLRVESARSAAYYAGWAAAHAPDELGEAAAIAKTYASEAYFDCAGENIQIHGGIGFTWEHDAHLYFKRAQGSRLLFGLPSAHRERVAARLLG
jgi:alkylation response protein AidB-like acyl-CoA dehydrogenase